MRFRGMALVASIMLIIIGLGADSAIAQSSKSVKSKSVKKTGVARKATKPRKAPKEIEVRNADEELERKTPTRRGDRGESDRQTKVRTAPVGATFQTRDDWGRPTESKLKKAGVFGGDLRTLPKARPKDIERPEREGPNDPPIFIKPTDILPPDLLPQPQVVPAAPAPTPLIQFDGMGRPPGNGFPPDTNGDVGPNHYIQTINTSLAIYDKSTGAAIVGPLSFNTFMSAGAFGNLCDTNNFGDPIVLYDTFEDRWIITDFAFTLDGTGNVSSPPGAFQCFAVSQTGDPVSGGWYYYSINIADTLNDYPKFGIWPDGLYMMANEFGLGSLSGSFTNVRVWAFNKAQMYAGAADPQIVSFDAPRIDQNGGTVFAAIPSNARLQTGTPPPGTPNYFAVTGTYTNALQVWKFSVDWDNVYNSSFTGASVPLTGATWSGPPATVPSLGGNALDTLATRAMMQNQYTNIGGNESIWLTHTVRNSTTAGVAAPRWYELSVTGGTVAASPTQAAFHEPDTTTNRFMPSLAVDNDGNMLIGYSASSSAIKPAIRYAGRLAGDPLSTLPQTETTLIAGGGTQVGNCGSSTCTRWGDYSAMSLDPIDGCTFWYTSQYYAADGLNYNTRIGSIAFPSCTAVGTGTVQGTVTTSPGGNPLVGATVQLGSRTATTNASGFYQFTGLPAGTYSYPGIRAIFPGYVTSASSSVVVATGGTAVKDFALPMAPATGSFVDTTQADFSIGNPVKIDLATSSGDLQLSRRNLDQFNASLGSSGVGITTTTWGGQTFTPSVTGFLTRADIALFCSGCTGTTPNLTVSVRATSGGLPTGADLATATITGFSYGGTVFYAANFAAPVSLNAGTVYALVIRPTANPSPGTYALTRSGSSTTGQSVYAGGTRLSGATSGTVWSIPLTGGVNTDAGFRTYMTTASGTFVSSVKDYNPSSFVSPEWTTLSWTAGLPASTTLQFQVAGSNNPAGPFNFVGPDTTAGSFYTTSGGSLAQFNGLRYLKYKAYLTTTDQSFTDLVPSVSATVNDVTIGFTQAPTAANVSISGRVLTSDRQPVRNAVVSMTDTGGVTRTVRTNQLGIYRFSDVAVGATYTIGVAVKQYTFAPRIISVDDNIADFDFVAEP